MAGRDVRPARRCRASTAAAARWRTCWRWARRASAPSSGSAATRPPTASTGRVAVYASTEAHHTIQRSAGVLGIGRRAVRAIPCDRRGRMRVDALRAALAADRRAGVLPMAIVANAGTTNTGAIDPLQEIGEIAHERRHLVPRRRRLRAARRARRARRAALRGARARRLGDRRSAQVAGRRGRRRRHLRARPRAAAPRLHAGAGGLPGRQHGGGQRGRPGDRALDGRLRRALLRLRRRAERAEPRRRRLGADPRDRRRRHDRADPPPQRHGAPRRAGRAGASEAGAAARADAVDLLLPLRLGGGAATSTR